MEKAGNEEMADRSSWEGAAVRGRGNPRKIPLGVILAAIYFAISGVLGVVVGAVAIAAPERILEIARHIPEAEKLLEGVTADYVLAVGMAIAVVSAVFLVIAWGLIKLKYWARLLAIGASAASAVSAIFSYASDVSSIVQIALPLTIAVYLFHPRVGRLFARRAGAGHGTGEGGGYAQPEAASPAPQEKPKESIAIQCPRCGTKFNVDKNPYGSTPIKCPDCGKEGIIP